MSKRCLKAYRFCCKKPIISRFANIFVSVIMTALSRVWTKRPLPTEHRANFIHLYLDIAWYGVLSGSAIAFMAIFAARQGANGFQLGLLNAAPAVVNLAVTLPAGQWLQSRPISRAVLDVLLAQAGLFAADFCANDWQRPLPDLGIAWPGLADEPAGHRVGGWL